MVWLWVLVIVVVIALVAVGGRYVMSMRRSGSVLASSRTETSVPPAAAEAAPSDGEAPLTDEENR
jgi:Tfp pilus assembly protein PilX